MLPLVAMRSSTVSSDKIKLKKLIINFLHDDLLVEQR